MFSCLEKYSGIISGGKNPESPLKVRTNTSGLDARWSSAEKAHSPHVDVLKANARALFVFTSYLANGHDYSFALNKARDFVGEKQGNGQASKFADAVNHFIKAGWGETQAKTLDKALALNDKIWSPIYDRKFEEISAGLRVLKQLQASHPNGFSYESYELAVSDAIKLTDATYDTERFKTSLKDLLQIPSTDATSTRGGRIGRGEEQHWIKTRLATLVKDIETNAQNQLTTPRSSPQPDLAHHALSGKMADTSPVAISSVAERGQASASPSYEEKSVKDDGLCQLRAIFAIKYKNASYLDCDTDTMSNIIKQEAEKNAWLKQAAREAAAFVASAQKLNSEPEFLEQLSSELMNALYQRSAYSPNYLQANGHALDGLPMDEEAKRDFYTNLAHSFATAVFRHAGLPYSTNNYNVVTSCANEQQNE